MIIGITGITGSGKTTLLTALAEAGATVLDCDAIYHQLLQQDPQLLAAIEARFPGTVENGILQRKKLGAIVFSDTAALSDLNRITHAAIHEEVLRQLAQQPAIAAIDAIALFESGLNEMCDVTVAIIAPDQLRLERLMQRDGISEEYARQRIQAQHSDDWFREKCDYTLENDGSPADFQGKCLAFFHEIGIM